mgnify:CR=1 FL=1|jgi:hypothetical protein
MADSKVTAMNPATSVSATDVLYLVKPSTSPYDHKVSVTNLFAAIPVPVKLDNTLTFGGTIQTLSSAGAISVTSLITRINSPSGAGTLTIADGAEGQIKVIVMVSNSASHALTISSNIGHSSIVFNSANDTATLMFLAGNWYFLGGTATVT